MNKLKKFLPILLVLCVLAIAYSGKMYIYEKDPALNSEIENIYHDSGTSKKRIATLEEGIQVKVGSFTCPAGTGNYSVTGIGFKPRVVEFRVIWYATTRIHSSLGWMDYNGNENVLFSASQDDLQVGNWDLASCINLTDTNETTLAKATYVSMDSDGFTINFSVVNTVFKIMWKAVR